MVNPPTRVVQARGEVFRFEIRQLLQNLPARKAGGEELKHVADPYPHAAHTWTPTALLRIKSDSLFHVLHGERLTECIENTSKKMRERAGPFPPLPDRLGRHCAKVHLPWILKFGF